HDRGTARLCRKLGALDPFGDLRCDCRYFARVKVKRVALFTHEIGVKLGDEKVAAALVRYIHHGVLAGSDFERNGAASSSRRPFTGVHVTPASAVRMTRPWMLAKKTSGLVRLGTTKGG